MSSPSTVSPVSSVSAGRPTDDEVVAIMAAMEALWPRPVAAADPGATRAASWRFSGRWWSRPVPMRRARPYY